MNLKPASSQYLNIVAMLSFCFKQFPVFHTFLLLEIIRLQIPVLQKHVYYLHLSLYITAARGQHSPSCLSASCAYLKFHGDHSYAELIHAD